MRVLCTISHVELENDEGREIEGVVATCSRCDNQTESFGTSSASIRRCLVLMREGCQRDEHNFYIADEDEEDC